MKTKDFVPLAGLLIASLFATNARGQVAVVSGIASKDTVKINEIFTSRDEGYILVTAKNGKNDTLHVWRPTSDYENAPETPRVKITKSGSGADAGGTLILETSEEILVCDQLNGAQTLMLQSKFKDANFLLMDKGNRSQIGSRFSFNKH